MLSKNQSGGAYWFLKYRLPKDGMRRRITPATIETPRVLSRDRPFTAEEREKALQANREVHAFLIAAFWR